MKIIEPKTELINISDPLVKIELCGRTCYKSEDKITPDSAEKFVKNIIARGHESVLEHAWFIVQIIEPEYIYYKKILNTLSDHGKSTLLKSTSDLFNRNIVSGNVRMWRDFMRNMQMIITPPSFLRIFEQFPTLFGDVMPEFPASTRHNPTAAKLISESDLINVTEIKTHASQTVRFTIDRGISHELVRHRTASFSQESTRYCLSGDTKLKTSNPHNKLTIKKLYENKAFSKNGAWKRIKIKQLNEDTGELMFSTLKNVFLVGQKEVFELTTKLGYSLKCTSDHEIYTETGYKPLHDILCGDRVYINGENITPPLYKNYSWLFYQNITLNKTFVEIAKEFNYNVSTLKKWARILNIPKKAKSYWNLGKTPWNKGLTSQTSSTVAKMSETLLKYHWDKDKMRCPFLGEHKKYRMHKKETCEICGISDNLHVHHINKNRNDNLESNLITLCSHCHQQIHSQNLQIAHLDYVVSIKSLGIQDVYDIEMNSKYHNFIANGIVVHNCNYSKDKFGNEITVIKPCFWDENSELYAIWKNSMFEAEESYFRLIGKGATAQEARSVLPNELKTEVVMTTNLAGWYNFFKQRTAPAAHPQMREVAIPLMQQIEDKESTLLAKAGIKIEEKVRFM